MKKNEVKKNNKGFSLVELIVVIAIMAVLVGVLAPQFIKYVERSRQSTDVQNADQVATALKTYYADSEDGTGTEDVVISHTATITSNAAITDAGLGSIKLKSSKWTQTAGGSEGIKVSLNKATGEVTVSGEATYLKADGTKK